MIESKEMLFCYCGCGKSLCDESIHRLSVKQRTKCVWVCKECYIKHIANDDGVKTLGILYTCESAVPKNIRNMFKQEKPEDGR